MKKMNFSDTDNPLWNMITSMMDFIRSSKSKANVSLKHPCNIIVSIPKKDCKKYINMYEWIMTEYLQSAFNVENILYKISDIPGTIELQLLSRDKEFDIKNETN